MNFADIIVDGLRIGDTDFLKFTRQCHLDSWQTRAKAAMAMGWDGVDDDALWKFGNFRRNLTEKHRLRLANDMCAREQNCPPRNLDLKVVKTFPKDWTDEQIKDNPGSCNIGLNDGRSPNEIVWADFLEAGEMTNYEFAAYGILGDEECDRQGIDSLYDMFGTEFANRFYKCKKALIAQSNMVALYKERAELNARIAALEEQAKG